MLNPMQVLVSCETAPFSGCDVVCVQDTLANRHPPLPHALHNHTCALLAIPGAVRHAASSSVPLVHRVCAVLMLQMFFVLKSSAPRQVLRKWSRIHTKCTIYHIPCSTVCLLCMHVVAAGSVAPLHHSSVLSGATFTKIHPNNPMVLCNCATARHQSTLSVFAMLQLVRIMLSGSACDQLFDHLLWTCSLLTHKAAKTPNMTSQRRALCAMH